VSRILRRLPRWLNRLYAKALCYFWIPCPICKREFGGHEAAETLLRQGGRMLRFDLLVCWRCEDAAKEANFQAELARSKLDVVMEHELLIPGMKWDYVVVDPDARWIYDIGPPRS